MKRAAYMLFCLLCTAGGVALGRYVWPPPAPDVTSGPQFAPAAAMRISTRPSVSESLAALPAGPRRAALILSLSATGGRRNLPALIEACAGDAAAIQFLADLWLQTDPGAFVRELAASKLMQGPHREQCAFALMHTLERWARQAPDAAWTAAESLPGTMRRDGLSSLAARRIEANPRAGLDFLKAHSGVVPGHMNPTLGAEGANLLPLIQELPESAAKSALLRQVIKGMPFDVPLEGIMATLRQSGGGMDTAMARRAALRQVAEHSLEEVRTFHATASGQERYQAAHVIGDQLLNDDPAAAVTWAQEHLSGDLRTSVIKKAAEHLQEQDPAAAEAARALLPENQRAIIE